jgi:peptide/nickel transport system substrate-binding protein
VKRRTLPVLGVALALTASAIGACDGNASGTTANGTTSTTLTLATAVDVNSFAPADSRDAHYVQFYQPVYDSLLQIAPDGTYQPDLATVWKYDASQTDLHLDLRSGVTFTDGEKFDGNAVKANLLAVQKGTSTAAPGFASIGSIVVNSPTSVDLKLSNPDPGLIRQLAMPGGMMAAPNAIGTAKLKTDPVGTGPYVLDSKDTTATVQYTFTRNPNYWNKKAYPYDKIVLKPISDQTARLNAIRSGQVDGGFGDATNIAAVKAAGLTVTQSPGPGFQGLFIFDRTGKIVPQLADVRVRQALNYAIDPKAVLQTLEDGKGTLTRQVFNPKSNGWDPALNDSFSYDPAKAKQLLAQAGAAGGFTIPIPVPVYPNLQPLLTQELGAVGIKVNWVNVPTQQVNDQYLSGRFAVVWYQLQSSDPWQAINFLGSPQAPWNPLHSSDPDISNQIDAIRKAPAAQQGAQFQKLAGLYIQKAWFVPAFFPDAVYFSSAKVKVTAQALQIVPSIANYAPKS